MEEPKEYRTLRGFLSGQEPDEAAYFAYCATLRFFGDSLDLDEISRQLNLEPTNSYKKGERRGDRSPPYRRDSWQYTVGIPETEPLHKHLDELWRLVRPKKDYLLKLKRSSEVNVFCGYRSNIDHAGVEVPHASLKLFLELEIPFDLSIVVA